MNQYRCETCTKNECENSPINPESYFLDRADNTLKMYPGIQDAHEFTSEFGCASHSDFKMLMNGSTDNATKKDGEPK